MIDYCSIRPPRSKSQLSTFVMRTWFFTMHTGLFRRVKRKRIRKD